MTEWLNTEQASQYLGISKTKLYELTQNGKIPVSKLGKKLMYSKPVLDNWLQASKPIEEYFLQTNPNIEDNYTLRVPQREGYINAYEFFRQGKKTAIVQLPVGCGKTGLISILPFGISKGRVLVIAPNLTIKQELYDNLDITNRQKCFWRKTYILDDKEMIAGPYVCSLEIGNISIAEKSHITVTNIQQLATNTEKWLEKFPSDFFDLIINDEAHHTAAKSWKLVFDKFKNAKIVNITATPFRSDRKDIEGELIYRYSFKSATIKGYIKNIKASYVAPSELEFSDDNGNKKYTLREVLKMKEETWFSRGIALSPICNINIVDNSLEKLEKLRETGTKHQIIAVAMSIRHAKQIRSLYAERGYEAGVVNSKMEKDEIENVIRDLKNGTLDCIVQVQMLGEGFDHPKLSVAAIFNPFRSLAPYIQFVGRILRVVVQNDPQHPDNKGYIVTHIGMNIDNLAKDFKDFENDDKKFWEQVTGGNEEVVPKDVINGNARMKFDEDMIVNNEIVDRLFEEDFISLDDEDIIKELEEKLKSLGMNPYLAKEIIEKDKNNLGFQNNKAAAPFPILPQKEWAELKKRLNEEVKRTAKLIINTCGLEIKGIEIPRKYQLHPGVNNFLSLIQLINNRSNIYNKERKDWSTEEFKNAMAKLSDIKNNIVKLIKGKQSEK